MSSTMYDGVIKTDELTLSLYSNDASMYEERPRGVTLPKTVDDIRKLVVWAAEHNVSITPRSAGTSLAGQATGDGIIMDVSRHMTEILGIDPDERIAHVQPGVIRDTLNRQAGKYNLIFGPDTSTTNRCMMGGMIGNNSAGSFSIKHGSTRDHIVEVEAVLSDGSKVVFEPLSNEGLKAKQQQDDLEGHIYREMIRLINENREAILEAYPYPEIIRRNTGYALDKLCTMQPFVPDGRPFNMAELLCGSEGTLAVTVSAKLDLTPLDPCRLLVIPQFRTLDEAMRATVEAVKHDPSAVELVDYIILDATKGNIEQRKNRFFLEDDPEYILVIQFEGDDIDKLRDKANNLQSIFEKQDLGYTCPVIEDEMKMKKVWDLRKAGLGLLMGLSSDTKSPSFCEDTSVRVQDLPAYVKDFRKLLDKYDTTCVFYAHASVGELHLRPVLDLKSGDGVRKMKAMAEEIADLVHSYKGSLSGEHGDGRARAPYIEKVLGADMMKLLKQVKKIWDPNVIFNPGKIVDAEPIDTDLRYTPSYKTPDVDTVFKYRNEKGFAGAVEQCNGAGVCRKLAESGGTMCPSYMATKEEKDTTRGRANLFRQLFSGKQAGAFTSPELKEALDLCLMCKGCKTECPANVDMAKMKSEFLNGWQNEYGVSLSHRFFGEPSRFYPLASLFPKLTNWFNATPVAKNLYKRILNVHPDRELPRFAERTFIEWFNKKHQSPSENNRPDVFLFVDIFTNYHEPGIAEAAVQVLEHLGYNVLVNGCMESGRTQVSKGLLEKARVTAQKNIDSLYPIADQKIPIIGLEPSEILMFRDEYLDICDDEYLDKAQKVADNTHMFEEFLLLKEFDNPGKVQKLINGKKKKVAVHGHCNAKALVGTQPTVELLTRAGFKPMDLLTGCCGMAGSFGYEADHYDVSMQIGELRLFPALRNGDDYELICAPGFSCRHQIKDGVQKEADHPAVLLAKALT